MSDAFLLRWKLDRPFLEQNKPEDVYVLITIEPNPALLAPASPPATMASHLFLLVDVSGSMDVLVRRDPAAQKIGEGTTEGKASQTVVSEVPSRREMAATVVQKMVERMGPDDLLTVVAFDDQAYTLAEAVHASDMDRLWQAIQRLTDVGGGGTNMGRAFEAVRTILRNHPDSTRTRKIVLLTDGEDEDPATTLATARAVGWDFKLPIVAFGTGECKIAFLTDLAKTSLAGAFNHIRDEVVAQQLFTQAIASQKNIQATNVQLQLWLSPELQIREIYRTRPEILFVGDLQPDEKNLINLRLEQMERGKAYEFLFRCSLPARPTPQRFRLAKATLYYDLPGQTTESQKVEANIVVEITADAARAGERSGDVRRVLSRAEVQRQVLFLQSKIDALGKEGSQRDRVIIANLLHALIQKFQELGDQAMLNQYQAMQDEFMKKGTISQDMLNRSLAASSRAEDIVVAQNIDF